LQVIGTLGVLIKSKEMNLIKTLKPLLDLLIENKIRISSHLYEAALKKVNEL